MCIEGLGSLRWGCWVFLFNPTEVARTGKRSLQGCLQAGVGGSEGQVFQRGEGRGWSASLAGILRQAAFTREIFRARKGISEGGSKGPQLLPGWESDLRSVCPFGAHRASRPAAMWDHRVHTSELFPKYLPPSNTGRKGGPKSGVRAQDC